MRFRPLVLCYHAISDRWADPLAVGAANLERQLRLLLRGRLVPVGAEAVLANRERSFHLTFDDAYRSVAAAMPILEQLGVSATVFACTDFARDGRQFLIPELRDRTGDHPDELLTMPWATLRELASRGVEIGSHSISHPHLPQLTDAELRRELVDSREQIEAEVGRACRFLAYPYGDDDARVHVAARNAGYRAAYTLRGTGGRAVPLALPRVDVYRQDGMARFAIKASPAGRPALAALSAIRRRGSVTGASSGRAAAIARS